MLLVELHFSRSQGEKSEVPAQTDVVAGVVLGAPLAEDDVAGQHGFAAKLLDAEALAVAVSSVLGSSLSFFVCHEKKSLEGLLQVNRFDLHHGKMLAVTPSSFVALPALFLEDDDFLAFLVFQDLRGYRCSFDGRGTKGGFSVIDDHQYLVYLDLITFICVRKTIQKQFVAFFYDKLAALCLYGSFHVWKRIKKIIFRSFWQASS